GVSTAVIDPASYETFVATGATAPAAVSVKLEELIVDASMAPEKAAVIDGVAEIPVDASGGLHPVTFGAPAVVKLQLTALSSGVPLELLTLESTRAVYVVPDASAALGASVATFAVAS